MNRFRALLALALVLSAVPVAAAAKPKAPESGIRAGVGVADATWHVGASAGQYASDRPGVPGESLADGEAPDLAHHVEGDHDPNLQSTKRRGSYGVQSRLTIRALVVEGNNGERVALVKSDNYLAQDHLQRRVAELLAGDGSQIGYDDILHHVTHNHSSPYYATPSWGVWLFQDVMDLRMFEFQARAMARAIREAEENLKPARMGAAVVPYGATQRNAPGEQRAHDGSPAGYPREFNDKGLTVLRFDEVTKGKGGKHRPLATWVNYGQHPESLDGYDLISADYLGPLERFVDRETGAPMIFSQGSVGSAEQPGRDNTEVLPDGTVRAFSHAGYAQAERGARQMADAVLAAWRTIGEGGGQVPYSSDFPVRALSEWVPGPASHPYPSVSNCRTEPTAEGTPGAPVLGLPDCERGGRAPDDNAVPIVENLKAHGIPVPDHYDAPGFTAVEENLRLRLQAVRLGDVVLGSCACEAQVDLILNFESRADDVAGNIHDGFDWAASQPSSITGVRSAAVTKMRAQVHNDAKGWDDPANAVAANSEPADPTKIWGNFTKEELPASGGYRLAVGVGHAGDYNGYTVSYREYMAYDHYRKALTAYGPHTADYMSTRMVRMAGLLKQPGDGRLPDEPTEPIAVADEQRQQRSFELLSKAAQAAYESWDATLPANDGGGAAVDQPADVTRFQSAVFSWHGGNNYVDNPVVRVERQVKGAWQEYADQTGEVITTVDFPDGVQSQATYLAGMEKWKWTATFEAFDAFPKTIDPRGPQVPNGTYRFVVDGRQRKGGETVPYRLESEPFTVGPWTGIEVGPLTLAAGDVSFPVKVAYPREDAGSPVEMVRAADRVEAKNGLCFNCTFRPWATTGAVVQAVVTVVRADGSQATVPAALQDGVWVANTDLGPGDRAFVAPGAVVDEYGETNGSASNEVRG